MEDYEGYVELVAKEAAASLDLYLSTMKKLHLY